MRIEFNRTGAERKALVTAIGEILGIKPKYMGMPTAAYEVGYLHIDKNGVVELDDRADSEGVERLLESLAERGFPAVEMPLEEAADENTSEPETPQQEAGMGLTVSMPRALFTDAALENVTKLMDAKGSLIKKALCIAALPIEVSDETVSFPWFPEMPPADEVSAYTHLITALCDMARNQKRITAREKDTGNDKYAFRCFLLRLGFIGPEYKEERKILLRNLSGSSAFKTVAPQEEVTDAVSE